MGQSSGRTMLPKNGALWRGETEQNPIACLSNPPFTAHYSPLCGQRLVPSEIPPPGAASPENNAS